MGGPNANINALSCVHMGSGGMSMATPPDVCLTPGPSGPPMPVPYPNVASRLGLQVQESGALDQPALACVSARRAGTGP